jgi:hypothetical protein
MASDNIAIVRFYEGWQQDGVGPDGLPLFREVVMIRKSVPPLTEVDYVADPADYEEFPAPYQLFLKEQGARKPSAAGYPLALWPVVSPADFKSLAARDIVTVEQLAALANKRAADIPASILELAKRAKKMIELQGSIGKFEALVDKLTAERDSIAAELREANATISAQNAMLARKVA